MKTFPHSLRLQVLLTLLFITCSLAASTKLTLSSPHKHLSASLTEMPDGAWSYQLKADGKLLISSSALGFEDMSGRGISGQGWRVIDTRRQRIRSEWRPLWGKRAVVPDCYNELRISFGNESSALTRMDVVVRAYDEGWAFRYEVPASSADSIAFRNERTQFGFADDFTAWYYNGENHNLGPERLSACAGRRHPVICATELRPTPFVAWWLRMPRSPLCVFPKTGCTTSV